VSLRRRVLADPRPLHGFAAYCLPNFSSWDHADLAREIVPGQVLWIQLYVHREREKSEAFLKKISALPAYTTLWVTVDTPMVGKREADERAKTPVPIVRIVSDSLPTPVATRGIAQAVNTLFDQDLNWEDLHWVRKHSNLPIILKGVQSWEDAKKAKQLGCAGVCLSNHGGRQLDYAPSGLHTLLEIHKNAPELLKPGFEIYIDGGARRGTDVLKALCLGAKAVGLGRPFHYSLIGHGTAGAYRACEILEEEISLSMKLMGARSIDDLRPDMINTADLDLEVADSKLIKNRMKQWRKYRSKI